jgi:hypothetical protein
MHEYDSAYPKGNYVAAINSSGSIDDSSMRTEILTDIAAKHDLSEAEQSYLLGFICATRKGYHILDVIHFRQASSPEVTKVLVLIENPATRRETRLRIPDMLSSLRLSKHDAKTVAGKLSEGRIKTWGQPSTLLWLNTGHRARGT